MKDGGKALWLRGLAVGAYALEGVGPPRPGRHPRVTATSKYDQRTNFPDGL